MIGLLRADGAQVSMSPLAQLVPAPWDRLYLLANTRPLDDCCRRWVASSQSHHSRREHPSLERVPGPLTAATRDDVRRRDPPPDQRSCRNRCE